MSRSSIRPWASTAGWDSRRWRSAGCISSSSGPERGPSVEDRLVFHDAGVGSDRDEKNLEAAERLVFEGIDALRKHRRLRAQEQKREGIAPRAGIAGMGRKVPGFDEGEVELGSLRRRKPERL